jgi:hypothetical protein
MHFMQCSYLVSRALAELVCQLQSEEARRARHSAVYDLDGCVVRVGARGRQRQGWCPARHSLLRKRLLRLCRGYMPLIQPEQCPHTHHSPREQ